MKTKRIQIQSCLARKIIPKDEGLSGKGLVFADIGKFCCVITKIAGLSSELAKVYQ